MHLKKLFITVTFLLTGLAINCQDRNNLIKPGTIWPDTEGKPNPARLSESNKLSGEWKTIGNPCRGTGDENKITFGSQTTYILPVEGKKNAFIYMGDRWNPDNLADSRHIWLPVEWENDNPVIKWYPAWDLNKLK